MEENSSFAIKVFLIKWAFIKLNFKILLLVMVIIIIFTIL